LEKFPFWPADTAIVANIPLADIDFCGTDFFFLNYE
jgi:hypothetical protein